MVEAGKRGMRVVLTFVNSWDDYGEIGRSRPQSDKPDDELLLRLIWSLGTLGDPLRRSTHAGGINQYVQWANAAGEKLQRKEVRCFAFHLQALYLTIGCFRHLDVNRNIHNVIQHREIVPS